MITVLADTFADALHDTLQHTPTTKGGGDRAASITWQPGTQTLTVATGCGQRSGALTVHARRVDNEPDQWRYVGHAIDLRRVHDQLHRLLRSDQAPLDITVGRHVNAQGARSLVMYAFNAVDQSDQYIGKFVGWVRADHDPLPRIESTLETLGTTPVDGFSIHRTALAHLRRLRTVDRYQVTVTLQGANGAPVLAARGYPDDDDTVLYRGVVHTDPTRP